MLLVFYLFVVVLAFLRPKSRHLTMGIFIFLWFMYTFSWYEGDLKIYQWVYSEIQTGRFNTEFEPGFTATMWICSVLGFSFTMYRFVLGGLICISLYRFFCRNTAYTALTTALYGLFPFFIFISVMRSGVASIFVLLALEALSRGKTKKYIVFVFVAMMFHYSSVMFFALLGRKLLSRRGNLILAILISCALAYILFFTGIAYSLVGRLTGREKSLQWFTKSDATANIKGTIAIAILIISMYVLSRADFRCCRAMIRNQSLPDGAQARFVELACELSTLFLVLLPIMAFSSPFMRLPYMTFSFFLISSINIGVLKQPDTRKECYPGVPPLNWMIILVFTLIWKLYYDLPYLKEGASLFSEYLDVTFIF